MNLTNKNTYQVTEQGNNYIEVYIQDKFYSDNTRTILIKRSELARLFNEHRVIGSKNNKFVVEY